MQWIFQGEVKSSWGSSLEHIAQRWINSAQNKARIIFFKVYSSSLLTLAFTTAQFFEHGLFMNKKNLINLYNSWLALYFFYLYHVDSWQRTDMATAADEDTPISNYVTCGNCLEGDGYLENPKRLACGHTFCEPCLQGRQQDAAGREITCNICQWVWVKCCGSVGASKTWWGRQSKLQIAFVNIFKAYPITYTLYFFLLF